MKALSILAVIVIASLPSATADARVAAFELPPGAIASFEITAGHMDVVVREGIASHGGGVRHSMPLFLAMEQNYTDAALVMQKRETQNAWLSFSVPDGAPAMKANLDRTGMAPPTGTWEDLDYMGFENWEAAIAGHCRAAHDGRITLEGDFRLNVWSFTGYIEGFIDEEQTRSRWEIWTGQREGVGARHAVVGAQTAQAFILVTGGSVTLTLADATFEHLYAGCKVASDAPTQEVIPVLEASPEESGGVNVTGGSEQPADAGVPNRSVQVVSGPSRIGAAAAASASTFLLGVSLAVCWFLSPSLTRRAVTAGQGGRAAIASALWVVKEPRNGEAHLFRAQALAGRGRHRRALRSHKVAARLLVHPRLTAVNDFDAARAHALLGEVALAAVALGRAIGADARLLWVAQEQRDFAACWGCPEFQALAARFGAGFRVGQ